MFPPRSGSWRRCLSRDSRRSCPAPPTISDGIGANEATAYRIQVGSTQGGNNYYDSGSLPTTTLSQTINTLPVDGSTIYVTLWTQINNQWANNQYYYTAPNLNISNIDLAAERVDALRRFRDIHLDGARGATAYKLWVGSTPGGHDIDIATGSYPDGVQTAVHNLPTNGQVLYVSVYAFINGTWVAQDTAVYKAATV